MHRIATALIVLTGLLLPASAVAGRVFGDIKMDGKPVAAGLPVTSKLSLRRK
jgi:hypothetical protein